MIFSDAFELINELQNKVEGHPIVSIENNDRQVKITVHWIKEDLRSYVIIKKDRCKNLTPELFVDAYLAHFDKEYQRRSKPSKKQLTPDDVDRDNVDKAFEEESIKFCRAFKEELRIYLDEGIERKQNSK